MVLLNVQFTFLVMRNISRDNFYSCPMKMKLPGTVLVWLIFLPVFLYIFCPQWVLLNTFEEVRTSWILNQKFCVTQRSGLSSYVSCGLALNVYVLIITITGVSLTLSTPLPIVCTPGKLPIMGGGEANESWTFASIFPTACILVFCKASSSSVCFCPLQSKWAAYHQEGRER